MTTLFLAAWLYLIAHASIGETLADPAACSTDTECSCALDCLDEDPATEQLDETMEIDE